MPLLSGCANRAFAGVGATMVPIAVAAKERLSRADDVRPGCLDGGWPAWTRSAAAAKNRMRDLRVRGRRGRGRCLGRTLRDLCVRGLRRDDVGAGATMVPLAVAAAKLLGCLGQTTTPAAARTARVRGWWGHGGPARHRRRGAAVSGGQRRPSRLFGRRVACVGPSSRRREEAAAQTACSQASGPQRSRSPSGGHGVRLDCLDGRWASGPRWSRSSSPAVSSGQRRPSRLFGRTRRRRWAATSGGQRVRPDDSSDEETVRSRRAAANAGGLGLRDLEGPGRRDKKATR